LRTPPTVSSSKGRRTRRSSSDRPDGEKPIRSDRQEGKRGPSVGQGTSRHAIDQDMDVLGKAVVRQATHRETGCGGLAAVVRPRRNRGQVLDEVVDFAGAGFADLVGTEDISGSNGFQRHDGDLGIDQRTGDEDGRQGDRGRFRMRIGQWRWGTAKEQAGEEAGGERHQGLAGKLLGRPGCLRLGRRRHMSWALRNTPML